MTKTTKIERELAFLKTSAEAIKKYCDQNGIFPDYHTSEFKGYFGFYSQALNLPSKNICGDEELVSCIRALTKVFTTVEEEIEEVIQDEDANIQDKRALLELRYTNKEMAHFVNLEAQMHISPMINDKYKCENVNEYIQECLEALEFDCNADSYIRLQFNSTRLDEIRNIFEYIEHCADRELPRISD